MLNINVCISAENIIFAEIIHYAMTHQEFKDAARQHQIDFKVNDHEINVPADRFPIRFMKRNGKEYRIDVRSSLTWKDAVDENGDYRIFFSGFRHEITEIINQMEFPSKGQMVTNLLRSEHIPYNLFYPMRYDLDGAAMLFNRILGKNKIAGIGKILIEYNPGGLHDGTSFDVFVEYDNKSGQKGGIGIEVKYTEKEYPIKRGTKEWNETHNETGIHLADNYRKPSTDCGWFKEKHIGDVPFEDAEGMTHHVVANQYRQIWRNHILGASMVLGLCDDILSEFTSLTIYPKGNGHFSGIWSEYESMLTPSGLETFRHLTYEDLFHMMQECFNVTKIPNLNQWMDYLNRRYIIK